MPADSTEIVDDRKKGSAAAEVTDDDSCRVEYTEIVPALDRMSQSADYTAAEFVDPAAEVNLPNVKCEPADRSYSEGLRLNYY